MLTFFRMIIKQYKAIQSVIKMKKMQGSDCKYRVKIIVCQVPVLHITEVLLPQQTDAE